jgi:hypothetical protein
LLAAHTGYSSTFVKDIGWPHQNARESITHSLPAYFIDGLGYREDPHDAVSNEPVLGASQLSYEAEEEDNGYETSDPDLESVVRIGNVVKHLVADSTVEDSDSSFRHPHFIHTSIPVDIDRVVIPKRTKKRSLGRITPSPVPSSVGVLGTVESVSSSVNEWDDEVVAHGEIDPEDFSRRLSKPVNSGTHIARLHFDDSSSSASYRQSPDLFARPFRLDSAVKRPPDTPTNTLASPQPFINVVPPTPLDMTDSSQSPAAGNLDEDSEESNGSGTVVPSTQSAQGLTGSSTPENFVPGTATVSHGTMTDFTYDEYTEDSRRESEQPSASQTPPSRQNTETHTHNSSEFSSLIHTQYSTDRFRALSSYDESDPPIRREQTTLHQEYIQSDPNRMTLAAKSPSPEGNNVSPDLSSPRSPPDAGSSPSPGPQSLTKIITDLEDMLNHALELAGRAVDDSTTALDQRDATERSYQGSFRGSFQGTILDSTYGGTDRAVTAPESVVDLPEMQQLPENVNTASSILSAERQTAGIVRSPSSHNDTIRIPQQEKPKIKSPRYPLPAHLTPATAGKDQSWNRKTRDTSSDKFSTQARKSYVLESRGTNTNTNGSISTFGPEQRYRMELGRDGEVILVRIAEKPPAEPKSSTAIRRDPENDKPTRRYIGGWEWGLWGKRFVAALACGVVALLEWIVGNYYAEIQQIQKHLQISSHLGCLGNSMFFVGLTIPTFFFWPLPLLHGRKPYYLLAISLLLPLQLPQALALPPYTKDPTGLDQSMNSYVVCLIAFRTVSGLIYGFAFMNAFATLLDLFGPDTGACCRGGVVYNNRVPQEGLDQFNSIPGGEYGVRLGIWVGIFAWLLVASPGVGFIFGKITIARTTPAWGFWIIAILGAVLLVMVIVAPEVRPPWKKCLSGPGAGRSGSQRSDCPAEEKGELRLVMLGTSPRWWGQEISAGLLLSWKMLHQYGFLLVAVYFGWVFAHVALVIKVFH